MSQGTISAFKIEDRQLEIECEQHNGCRITHKYWSVPPSVIKKFINAKKAPTASDVDGWVRDAKEKRDKANNNDKGLDCYCSSSFWTCED